MYGVKKKFVTRNMGTLDRVIRTVMGLAMIYFGLIDPTLIGNITIAFIVGVFGAVSIAFAFVAFCPIYTLGNINTISIQNAHE